MFCGKCGKRLIENNIFCTGCGALIVHEEPSAAQPLVKAVAVAAPPVVAAPPNAAAGEFVPLYADETAPDEPEIPPEQIEQMKKNMTVHAAVFAAVAALLVVSLLLFNPTRLRYDVLRDEHGLVVTNPFGQDVTVTQGAGPWGLFTQPVSPDAGNLPPAAPTQPNEDQTTTTDDANVTSPDVSEEVLRGIALFNARQFPAAMQLFNSVLAVDPENFNALAHRGMAHFELNNFHDAIADLTAAHRLTSDNPQVLVWRGASFFNIGFYAEAVADLTAAITINPANPIALEFRGRAFEAMGNHAAAIADQESAAALLGVAAQ